MCSSDLAGMPQPAASAVARLIGSRMKVMETNIVVAVAARNNQDRPAMAKCRFSLTDANDNTLADREADLSVGPNDSAEIVIDVTPVSFDPYVPPFRLKGDVISADTPDLSARLEETVAFANAFLLFESFADVQGGWAARGMGDIRQGPSSWTVSESPRYAGLPQNGVRVTRVELKEDGSGGAAPPGCYAMRVELETSGGVFNMRDPASRYLPGDAFRIGFWIKGDGSGARVTAMLHDYSDMADFWHGGWKRVALDSALCSLDFRGWRYIEIDLPGGGVGTHLPKGSTPDVDFPLELAGLYVDVGGQNARSAADGTAAPGKVAVEFGPIFVRTQMRHAEAFSVAAGYDDQYHAYRPDGTARLIVQNGWPWQQRLFNITWTLLDREGTLLASGKAAETVPPGDLRVSRIDLAAFAPKISGAAGPLRLRVAAEDAADPAASATSEIMLAKPDSLAPYADFEEQRGYLGFATAGLPRVPQGEECVARTTNAPVRTGDGALWIGWSREEGDAKIVSLDPPLPGQPVGVSLWLHGDGSGAIFYPLAGDRAGVNKGAPRGQWDLFPLQMLDDPGMMSVKIDWKGWKQLRFRLPSIPPSWNIDLPVLSFAPSYPLGLHLVLGPGDATNVASAAVAVDDIQVETHLSSSERVGFAPDIAGELNIVEPGGEVRGRVWNSDAAQERSVRLKTEMLSWSGAGIPVEDQSLMLKPGESRRITVARRLPAGAYLAKFTLLEGQEIRMKETADILVCDMRRFLGEAWRSELEEAWKLRGAIESRFEVVDEDWDWVEYYPANFQIETARGRLNNARARGAEPYLLIGYSAYWAAGEGLQSLLADSFARRPRDAGHAVDIFMVPERLRDWEDYVCALMRDAGQDVAGWVLWDNPDAPSGPMSVRPERFAEFLKTADRCRRVYCADRPLLIGGLQRETAPAFLDALAGTNALDFFTGVHVRLDLGRLSPEDAQLDRIVRELRTALRDPEGSKKTIVFTDIDWAVEKSEDGLGVFDQAAYLCRAALRLDLAGLRPTVNPVNGDYDRFGLGVAYRRQACCPPATFKPKPVQVKPGWLGLADFYAWRKRMKPVGDVEFSDVMPGKTWGQLYATDDGRSALFVWRNDDPGLLSWARTGCRVLSCEDIFGSPIDVSGSEVGIGKVPVLLVIDEPPETAMPKLVLLEVRSPGGKKAWFNTVVARVEPERGNGGNYASEKAEGPASFVATGPWGDEFALKCFKINSGGVEKFSVPAPQGRGLTLRKLYYLDEKGHSADVSVNGKTIGTMNLLKTDPQLSSGLRDAVFVVDAAALGGSGSAAVEVSYPEGGNTVRWIVYEGAEDAFPLTAMGPIHSDQKVGWPRPGRNIVGGPLRVGTNSFAVGFGCYAPGLMEFPLNRQFKRFVVSVGVDAATEGKGSVVFEIYGDGKKIWTSGVMSGLDAPKQAAVSVDGIDRLRLVLSDAGDGNRFDAGDWCDPLLSR